MPRGSSGAGLLPCRDRVRGLRTRPRRHDPRRRAGVARVRLGPAGVAGTGRAAEHDQGPRQRPLDLDRLAEKGRVWTADPPPVPGPNLPAAEVAAPDPDLEERRAVPRPGLDGD